jgi:hypothetical protein
MLNGKVVDNTGKITWYKDGLRHREDGPAVEHSNGYKSWFTNGKRYVEAWYQNGLRHRTDGPAVECPDGHKEWWIDGVQTKVEYPDIAS